VSVNVKTEAVFRGLGKATEKLGATVAQVLLECAQMAADESQVLVPKDTGALAASMTVTTAGRGLGAKAYVNYGASYAFVVHENPNMAHAPPTQYKYLTKAVERKRAKMVALLKRKMEVAVRGVPG
jgi:hypothetical protein